MTKEEIKKKLFEMAKIDHSSILGTTRVERMFDLESDFIISLLSEQQSKHEQKVKELYLALKELVDLKKMKFMDGEYTSDEYLKRKPIAWKVATELINNLTNKTN